MEEVAESVEQWDAEWKKTKKQKKTEPENSFKRTVKKKNEATVAHVHILGASSVAT